MRIFLVVSDESGQHEILGEYARTEEDSVAYWREDDGTLEWAPEDCVRVVKGTRSAPGFPAREIPAGTCPTCGRECGANTPPNPCCVQGG